MRVRAKDIAGQTTSQQHRLVRNVYSVARSSSEKGKRKQYRNRILIKDNLLDDSAYFGYE